MAMLNNQMVNLMEDAVAVFLNDRRCDKMWDVNWLLAMMGIEHRTLWDVTLEKNMQWPHVGMEPKGMAPAHLFTFKCMYVYVLYIPYHSLIEKTTTSNMVNLCQS